MLTTVQQPVLRNDPKTDPTSRCCSSRTSRLVVPGSGCQCRMDGGESLYVGTVTVGIYFKL
jgi:hypothetical protein